MLIGDHIAILKDGALRQVGTGAEILLKPADDHVARFVRDVNRARIIRCGSLADPTVTGVGEVAAEDALEAAYGALANAGVPLRCDGRMAVLPGALP